MPIPNALASRGPAVAVDGLHLSFGGNKPVLADISLNIAEGEFVSLVGPSGCGKTTLLNLCAGLLEHTGSGFIKVMGSPPRCGNPQIGYMLARDSLLPWCSALDNAAFGAKIRGQTKDQSIERARKMLAEVGLAEHANALPKALSHGMRQRTALARTFALDAPLLLMDEPFGALDAQTKLQLQDLLLRLCHQHRQTALFVTHDLAEAVAVSDRVIVMSSQPGRIIADVPIDLPRPRSIRELQKSPRFHELFATLWSQLESGWVHHEG
ncbi:MULTISPECIES: ABC transporter ATP-binding protein [Comamonas]|uniref:Aliphatic sulfonates import ATP-binding protein SsuB n=1 Tax=Comamonas testosteroni TaxID=285 RepID=A0A8B4S352_COMTE|nr:MULTISPECIES: ABC transporter ATP-binding protein [Comamonas]EHN64954.1 ABC transporter ATPase [Comamonas testosteroni ATCC 11996]QQN69622.1 ABC transporter ATP-binding protein [Comamonas testosteroni]RDI10122.1 NitT/TauT family transport system ATP-binding protein [Comamonas sp. AG1104]SUY76844.1 Aliphatic sulfonates import ATP-binding protein SsuB [Comamonas testosteroni]